MRADGRAVGGRGGERRGLGLEELRGPGLREPPREDRVRIAAEPVEPCVHRARIYCREARIRSEAMAATRTIEIRTGSPGPRSRAIAEREERVIARPLLVHLPIFAERAENATITDVDGNVFVDFAGGVGVVNAGHGHPRIVEAVVEQAARFLHTDFTVVPYEPAVALAERLCALAPISGETRAAFFNAGTEAVENAVKLARLHTGRPGVIAFEGAFHGRTLLSMTMTSKFHPYKTGMGPYAPEVYRAPYPDEYRGPDAAEALARLERMFETHVAPEHVAAIVIEPQLGEGGFVPASRAVHGGAARDLRPARDRARRRRGADRLRPHGPDVRDGALRRRARPDDGREVDRGGPSALGRDRAGRDHGRRARRRDRRDVHRQSRRTGGRARRARRIRGGGARRARRVSSATRIRERMLDWQRRWPAIGDVRGLGAMLAIELVHDPVDEGARAGARARRDRRRAAARADPAQGGVHGNCIRVLCPLTIEDAVLDEALDVWEDALASVLA